MRTCLTIVFVFFISSLSGQNALSLCREMLNTISGLQTVKLRMESSERVNGKYVTTDFLVKRSRKPLNLYYKQFSPKEGAEVLLNTNGKVWVNPGSFPWVTLDLDPNSSLLRKDQHHSILDAGYDYFALLLADLFKKYADSLQKNVVLTGTEKVGNYNCYKITFSNPAYKIYSYKTQKEETPLTLASRLKISEFKICELNGISLATDKIAAGTTLKLPNDYSKGMILWIDTKLKIPAKMEVYDEKGLYEKYVFKEIVVNPVFKKDEFDRNYSEYNLK